jgi:VWFA-related protein
MRLGRRFSDALCRFTASVLAFSMALPMSAQNAQAPQTESVQGQKVFTFKSTSDLVLVNVIARDRKDNVVRDLKSTDFTIFEDGKEQRVSSFDAQDVSATTGGGPEQITTAGTPIHANVLTSDAPPSDLRDRRVIALFFDFGSMQPDESQRAIDAARTFVEKQMTPADVVAIVSYSTSLRVIQDFTSDRDALTKVLKSLSATEGEGLAEGTTGDDTDLADTGASFTADDSEYNLFSTDMKLQAIASLSQALGRLQQRKSVLYFSGGLSGTGADNQAQLRAAINTAVRANVAFYPVDIRGLQAIVPGGSASSGSLRGTSAYSGRAMADAFDSNFASQETLVSIASGTGGKAFLDSNNFGKAFTAVQQENSVYYLIGYRSSNRAMDGRYRHISIKANRPDLKLEYRAGYYGPRDFAHFTHEDRDRQLDEEMISELPNTDLPIYVATSHFRMEDDRYFVAISLVVPGSAVPFTTTSDKDKATLDVVGVLRDQRTKYAVGNTRDTVKLAADTSQKVRRKNIQYETGFLLPAGTYHLKYVVRENQTGRLGSFETDVTVPDLKKAPLKMSSVILASQKRDKPKPPNPLPVVPNIAHVFSSDQPLYLYYEVYDPAKKPDVHLLTSIQFFSGKVKAYETPLVEAKELNTPQRKAATFVIEVPLSQLRPGWYTCQVNVIDDAGSAFAFPRLPLLIRQAASAAAQTAAVPAASTPSSAGAPAIPAAK